jgi:hypothetical protein
MKDLNPPRVENQPKQVIETSFQIRTRLISMENQSLGNNISLPDCNSEMSYSPRPGGRQVES